MRALLLAVSASFLLTATGNGSVAEDAVLTDVKFLRAINQLGLEDIGVNTPATIVARAAADTDVDVSVVYYKLGSSCVRLSTQIDVKTRKILNVGVQGEHGIDACADHPGRINNSSIAIVAVKVLQIVSGIKDRKEIGDALVSLKKNAKEVCNGIVKAGAKVGTRAVTFLDVLGRTGFFKYEIDLD
jgi:hypothetical protein